MTSLKEALLAAMAASKQKEQGEENPALSVSPETKNPVAEKQAVEPPKIIPPEEKKEFLNSTPSPVIPREVPEDVLRGVLFD